MVRSLVLGAALAALVSLPVSAATDAEKKAVLTTYSDIAFAKYEDSLITAKAMKSAVAALIAGPSAATMDAAKTAWLAARVPYQQTEVYRFGNAIVDDWEGKVNAWPLDEGLIDYVATSYGTDSDENPYYTANVIANSTATIAGQTIDASVINTGLIQSLHEIDEVEANVSTGYHAIEFLLWGQDLNGTGPGAGSRSHTDFDTANCTNENCDRRADYLMAATDLLIADLEEMLANWTADGLARKGLVEGNPDEGIATILTGMGSLSYGELAGERMKLGLLLHDPEEEHDCFADNTHNSHYYDVVGIRNVYLGRYERIDGTVVSGASLSSLVAASDGSVDSSLTRDLNDTVSKMGVIVASAEAGEAYDQLIAEGNAEGNAIVQAAIDALLVQTKSIERAVGTLGLAALAFEGSDSLDNPSAVFQ